MRLIMHTLNIMIPAKKARNGSGLDGWIAGYLILHDDDEQALFMA
jgi:hypothetical protein